MSTETDAMAPPPTAASAAASAAPPRVWPFYWSLRRELWEHRSIWAAPAALALVALVGGLVSLFHLPEAVRAADALGGDHRQVGYIVAPLVFAAFGVVVTGVVTAMVYSLGALHNERRDRSILFWKSLPVSDLTTVLSKAAVPILVVPPVQLAIAVAAQAIMLAAGSAVVLASGADLGVYWTQAHAPFMWLILLRGLPYMALWYAPVYAWLMLVSGWARRAPFLWAVVPPLAVALLERLAFGTSMVWTWIRIRMFGAFEGAFSAAGADRAHQLDSMSWTSPHLWTGLVLAAALLAVAVRVRRSADPI